MGTDVEVWRSPRVRHNRPTEPVHVARGVLTPVDTVDDLERGRDAYRRRAWLDAYTLLSLAETGSLAPTTWSFWPRRRS